MATPICQRDLPFGSGCPNGNWASPSIPWVHGPYARPTTDGLKTPRIEPSMVGLLESQQ